MITASEAREKMAEIKEELVEKERIVDEARREASIRYCNLDIASRIEKALRAQQKVISVGFKYVDVKFNKFLIWETVDEEEINPLAMLEYLRQHGYIVDIKDRRNTKWDKELLITWVG